MFMSLSSTRMVWVELLFIFDVFLFIRNYLMIDLLDFYFVQESFLQVCFVTYFVNVLYSPDYFVYYLDCCL